MAVVLGLDGGGSKTELAIVTRRGEVMRWVSGPGLDPMAGDWEGRLAGMAQGLGAADQAMLGLPYFGEVPEISKRQQAVARQVFGPGAQVRNDVDVAFAGALGGAEGVLILAGTGSMAWARGPKGVTRAGGFGDAFGDEGSAHWIGCLALAAVARHLDGRRPAAGLAAGILAGLGIAGGDLIGWTYGPGKGRAEIAAVARSVAALAAGGNGVATGILRHAARELAALGRAAGRAAGLKPLTWSHAGGVLGNPSLRNMVADALGVAPVAPMLPPVGGAVLEAARAAGWDVGAGFVDCLAESLRQAAENKEKT